MKPISCNLIRSTAAVCVLMVSGFVHAEDGVVRISDRSSSATANSGVVRVSDHRSQPVQAVNYQHGHWDPSAECAVPQQAVCQPGCEAPIYCPAEGCQTYGRQFVAAEGCFDGGGYASQCCPDQCCPGQHGPGQCCPGQCGPAGHCCQCGPCCQCGQCSPNGQCCCNGKGTFGACHQQNMNCLFAGSVSTGTGCPAHDFWHGQSLSFRNKNARLSNLLFGWMVPSGCCGQGCPPFGKYHVTYADQPDYADPRDGQLYGAQGYGMPMTVPLAPNVRQQYNYSWGVPASRLTPISNYNPMTSPQPLYHQTW